MMRGDCLVRTPARPWSPALQIDAKETHINDSGISPGRSSAPSNSPISPSRPTNSPDSSNSPYTRSPGHNGLYPHSPSTASSPPEQPEGSLERLKMALERSSALAFYKNDTEGKDSENQLDTPRKEYPCPLCAYTTPYRHRFNEHVSTHYSDKCTLCDFKGQNIMDLRSHLADVHGLIGGEFADWADQTDQAETPSDGMEEDENGRRNKPKNFRCKHCPFVTCTKVDFWEHTKTHIKAEKLLTCTKCPFVTEYKHHLEYHLRNHFGSKPFKCTKCSYSCVNKSMLNSHLKSHSNVYQYRCADCAYATKYCHSLKLHLRKYEHSPAMVLNQDGSPNPLPIIDVYGTRRGPKQKTRPTEESEKQNLPGGITVPQVPSTDESQPKYIFCQLCEFFTASPEIFNQHIYLHNSETAFAQMLRTNNNVPDASVKDYFKNIFLSMEQPASPMSMISPHQSPLMLRPASPLDLSKSETEMKEEKNNKKNRRKGKAYKLERMQEVENDEDSLDYKVPAKEEPLEHHQIEESTSENCMEPIVNIHEESQEVKMEDKNEEDEPIDVVGDSFKIKIPVWRPTNETSNISEASTNESTENKTDKVAEYSCNFCEMIFRDVVMYTMHMGYHGYKDPFTCNMCGQETSNRVDFFLHIARVSHT